MPPDHDPAHLELLIYLGLPVIAVLLAVLGWSMRSILRDLQHGVSAVGADVRALMASVGKHDVSLGRLETRMQSVESRHDGVERRVEGIEQRERERLAEER